MKNYIIRTVDGASIPITEEQRNKILQEEANGTVRVFVGDCAIRLNTMNIYDEKVLPQNEGFLHDGTRVVKKFGEWVDANNPEARLNAAYYPEIARDEVFTPLEWKQRNQTPSLPSGEKPAIGMRGASDLERIDGESGDSHALDT